MNKKRIRHCFNVILSEAEKATCKDLHHKKSHQHEHDEACPAEYELYKCAHEAREYLRSVGVLTND